MRDYDDEYLGLEDDELTRLDRGFTGQVAHLAQLFCIGVFCAMWPFLAWWTLF